jgi:hypothetical protein
MGFLENDVSLEFREPRSSKEFFSSFFFLFDFIQETIVSSNRVNA